MTATVTRPRDRGDGAAQIVRCKTVLDGIDLDVAEGTVAALLGPKGAGKTIMVHILSTLLRADAGPGALPAMRWPSIAQQHSAVRCR